MNLSFVMNAILNLSLSLFRIVLNLRPCQGKFRQATWLKKVTTGRNMKSRQETTSLGQIATVTAKLTISDKHL